MNRSQEDYIFHAFKDLYNKFPVGQCIRGEQPDYIINTVDKIIGVEITQIFVDNYINPSINQKRIESLQVIFGDKLCEKLEQIIPFKFVLSVDFSLKGFSQNEIDRIVLNCVNYLKTIQFSNEFVSIDVDNFGQLPDAIDSINFFHYPSLQKPFFSQSAGGVLPDLTLQHLQIILNKKHKALKQYRRCDKHWLLIVEGTFLSDGFGDIFIEEFESDFQNVFLYRHAKGEVLQLK
ncbi:MAG: hypothetical protein ACOH2A_09255 [Sphingobacteriaceae bacterium]